jgi:hypothetical protein
MKYDGKPVSHFYKVWMQIIVLIRCYPSVIMPFFLWGLLDFLLLFCLFLLPGASISSVFPEAPSMGKVAAVQYPAHLFHLPRLFSLAKDFFGLFAGALFVGTTVSMIAQALQGKRPVWVPGARKVIRRYARYTAIWAIMLLASLLIVRAAGSVDPGRSPRLIHGLIGFLGVAVMQMLFVFSIPSMMIENKKIGASLKRSVALFKEYRTAMLMLVGIPYAFVIPLLYAYTEVDHLVERFTPLAILYILGVRILILAIIDFFVISSATVLLLQQRESEKNKT